MWTGKIRFEPRIGAEVEIKYPKKKQTKQQQKQQQQQKRCGFKTIPIRVDGA